MFSKTPFVDIKCEVKEVMKKDIKSCQPKVKYNKNYRSLLCLNLLSSSKADNPVTLKYLRFCVTDRLGSDNVFISI